MANPIAESTERYLAGLAPGRRTEAEHELLRDSVRPEGVDMDLADEINLAKAVKCVAGADGLSLDELAGLKYLMILSGLPLLAQQHVEGFDASTTRVEDVAALFPPASRKACYVVSGVTTVAALDGLSNEERDFAVELGASLGLSATLVELLVAEGRSMAGAMKLGHQELVAELARTREAIYDYVFDG
ncbi:MAG: hypothetical protein R6X02_08175 [Enhygromyxa sp.]